MLRTKVVAVREGVTERPENLICHRAQKLYISTATLHRIDLTTSVKRPCTMKRDFTRIIEQQKVNADVNAKGK